MNKLTEEEFQDRVGALARAKRIFPDVMNVSERFKIYQEVFAEREREIFISTQVGGSRPLTVMDNYERPKCPECGGDMMFRPLKDNEEGFKTQLVCTNQKCDTVLNSGLSINDWMKTLEKVSNGSEQTKAIE